MKRLKHSETELNSKIKELENMKSFVEVTII